ncbi:YtxH domain-containing protein [Fredinandcohnia onubensis]|uniref:YtxH domain-containing protein n=1 Tax=Fredinandcohnia onubensis TaxID=1571209 RepID=UPI000C0BF2FA|nr:YtxH domain-containing protein [Fredinandcohnia onubensis]
MGKNSGSNFILGTIVGAAVGAATALFLAPKTGQEFRRQINDQASVVKEKTNSLSKTISEQSNQILTKVKDYKPSTGQSEPEVVNENNEPAVDAATEEITQDTAGSEQLFQEKLAEAKQALDDAENNTQTTNY